MKAPKRKFPTQNKTTPASRPTFSRKSPENTNTTPTMRVFAENGKIGPFILYNNRQKFIEKDKREKLSLSTLMSCYGNVFIEQERWPSKAARVIVEIQIRIISINNLYVLPDILLDLRR